MTRSNLLSSSSDSSDDDNDPSDEVESGHRSAIAPKKLTPSELMLRELTSALKEFGGFECKSGMEHRKDVLRGMGQNISISLLLSHRFVDSTIEANLESHLRTIPCHPVRE